MTILPFLAVCISGAVLTLLVGGWPRAGRAAGLAALAAASGAALAIRPGEGVTIGDFQLAASWYAALFLTAGTGTCLLLGLVGLAALGGEWPERLAPAALATFGALGVALSVDQPAVALLAGAAAATPALLVVARRPAAAPEHGQAHAIAAPAETPRPIAAGEPAEATGEPAEGAPTTGEPAEAEPATGLREIRIAVLVAGAAALAAAWALGPSWGGGDAQTPFVFAYLALAVAVGVRSGVVPFHVAAARLSAETARLGLPLLLVWIPTGLGLLALGWTATGQSLSGGALDPAAGAVVSLGVATLLLGAIGALLHGELEEIAVYSIVQDAGFLLIALGARSPAAAEPARAWLLAFALSKSALVAWAAGVGRTFGTSRLDELGGWWRRAPLLGLSLVVIAAATVGWPGSPVFDARFRLVELALPAPLRLVGPAALLLSLACFGRLALAGARQPSHAVRQSRGERPARLPAMVTPRPAAPGNGRRTAGTAAAGLLRRTPAASLAVLRLNRVPVTSALILALALFGSAVAAGGLGAREAVRSGLALDAATAPPVAAGPSAPVPTAAATESRPVPAGEASSPAPATSDGVQTGD